MDLNRIVTFVVNFSKYSHNLYLGLGEFEHFNFYKVTPHFE